MKRQPFCKGLPQGPIKLKYATVHRVAGKHTSITILSAVDPTEVMDQYYKLRIKITEVVSTDDDWWYMGVQAMLEENLKRTKAYTYALNALG